MTREERSCLDEALRNVADPGLSSAIEAHAGTRCPGEDLDSWRAECAEGQFGNVRSGASTTLVSLFLGSDVTSEMQNSLCLLREELCREGRVEVPGHPLSQFLQLALFGPWLPQQRDVRMNDLTERPRLVVSATSTLYGDRWSASQAGAGVRERIAKNQISPTWREHQAGGPRLSDAVAASACYPLFCRPILDPVNEGDDPGERLTDGGINDNTGILALEDELADTDGEVDLLIVASAQRPFSSVTPSPLRLDTLLRLHDILIDQKSAQVVAAETELAERSGICVVTVSLADDVEATTGRPAKASLASLPTDLRPIKTDARRMLRRATDRFKERLRGSPCARELLHLR